MKTSTKLDYYYIVLGQPYDFHRYAYNDLETSDYGRYYYEPINKKGRLINAFFRIHTSEKINSKIKLPFKRFWFKRMTYFKNENKKICFIFYFGTKWFNAIKYGYLKYLKKRFPNCRLVCYYADLVSTHEKEYPIEKVKKQFDYVLSFDLNDCLKYGLFHYPLIYSSNNSITINRQENDVFFVGLAKNRLNEIINAFIELTKAGLKCDFHIVGAKKDQQLFPEKIIYGEPMTYEENIKHIQKAKAVLEIMQKEGQGFTLRTCEAIAFGKVLITNNKNILAAPFYSPKRVVVLGDKNVDYSIIKNAPSFIDYDYIENLTPHKMFEFIEGLTK